MITRIGFLRLPLVLFGGLLLLLTTVLMLARRDPSTAYWITAAGGDVGAYGLYRMQPDGSEAQRIAKFTAITGHAWSPDGRSLVVAGSVGLSGSHLYRVGMDGAIVEQIVLVGLDHFYPAFSPDGQQITYTTRGLTMDFQIHRLNLKTGLIAPLIESSGGATMGAWSPDGTYLAYTSQRTDYGADIYLRDLQNGPTYILTSANGADASPEFSPDGQWVAFMSDRTGSFHIYVMRVDGSAAHSIGGRLNDERWPIWTPDGEWVIFSSIGGDGTPTLYQMRPDGTDLHRLSPPNLPLAAAKCSPLIDRTWHPTALLLLVGSVWGVGALSLVSSRGRNPIRRRRSPA
ncbi:MAG: hypothetical protein K8L91_19825 [Anaerolineae bacterium]|nr:hypothetical protein [Anaerolineae bacterium]